MLWKYRTFKSLHGFRDVAQCWSWDQASPGLISLCFAIISPSIFSHFNRNQTSSLSCIFIQAIRSCHFHEVVRWKLLEESCQIWSSEPPALIDSKKRRMWSWWTLQTNGHHQQSMIIVCTKYLLFIFPEIKWFVIFVSNYTILSIKRTMWLQECVRE